MKYDCILIRYGELALKKNNRKVFVERLKKNIAEKLIHYPQLKILETRGRLFIDLHEMDHQPVIEKLREVFGIVGFSPALKVNSELSLLKEAAVRLITFQKLKPATFKVISRRSDKRFPYSSQELNHDIGGYILDKTEGIRVDVHQPELSVNVEVRGRFSYIYGNDILGLGGLPVGSSGRVMLLLSGGIDSPVAGYLASKRGGDLLAIHFHSFPFTSERAKQKVIDLAQQMTRFSGSIRLFMVPLTEVQTQIREHCFDPYSITIMRRFMLRIATQLARKHDTLALVTGESMGQVASQTLESMHVINEVTSFPILRPLIGMDKTEIIRIAKQINTYETSILPYEDCCTLFVPKSPKTKPSLSAVEKQEAFLDVEQLVKRAVDGTELIDLSSNNKDETEFSYF